MGGKGSGRPRERGRVTERPRIDVRALRPQLHGAPAAVVLGNDELRHTIRLEWDPCQYGGARPWFVCPCGRRAALLYLGSTGLRCRRCEQLAYPTSSEEPFYRLMRRAKRLNRRIGGNGNLLASTPPRPAGMHRSTYLALRVRYERTRLWMWAALFADFARMDAQLYQRFPDLRPEVGPDLQGLT